MIISIMAKALVQCMARIHAGWMVLAGSVVMWVSAAARLDISAPSEFSYGNYTPGTSFPLLLAGYQKDAGSVSTSQKSEPGCPGSPSRTPYGAERDARCLRGRHQHGIDHMDH